MKYFQKQAASKLRSAVKVISEHKPPGYNFSIPATRYKLDLAGKDIGGLTVFNRGTSTHVSSAHIKSQFQGMGLGKKLYGEVIMREGQLNIGSGQSKDALRLWASLRKRYQPTPTGEGVLATKNPSRGLRLPAGS